MASEPEDAAPDAFEANINLLVHTISNGNSPPEWLRDGLSKAAASIRFAIAQESRHPTRMTQRQQLTAVQTAVKTLRSGILNTRTRDALEGRDRSNFETIRGFFHCLEAFSPLVEDALLRLEAVSGPGRHKHYPQEVRAPLLICAAFVCVAWNEVRNDDAPHTSSGPQNACEYLWSIAGGGSRAHSSGKKNVKGWRDQLQKAKGDLGNGIEYARYRTILRGIGADKHQPPGKPMPKEAFLTEVPDGDADLHCPSVTANVGCLAEGAEDDGPKALQRLEGRSRPAGRLDPIC